MVRGLQHFWYLILLHCHLCVRVYMYWSKFYVDISHYTQSKSAVYVGVYHTVAALMQCS